MQRQTKRRVSSTNQTKGCGRSAIRCGLALAAVSEYTINIPVKPEFLKAK